MQSRCLSICLAGTKTSSVRVCWADTICRPQPIPSPSPMSNSRPSVCSGAQRLSRLLSFVPRSIVSEPSSLWCTSAIHCAGLQSRKSPAITVMRTRSRSLYNRLRHRDNSSTGTLGYNSRKWKFTLYILNIKLFLLLVHLQFRTTFVRVIKCLYIAIDLYT